MRLRALLRRHLWTPSRRLVLLRAASPFAFTLERVFAALQYLFPIVYLLRSRSAVQLAQGRRQLSRREALRRGRQLELYLFVWVVIELVILFFSPTWSKLARGCGTVVAAYRVADIVQTAVNVNIFDRHRVRSRHRVSSVTRLALLALWNYFENALCFSAIYTATSTSSLWEAVYFSFGLQVGIGPSLEGLSPSLHWVPLLQMIIAFLLAVIAISRFVGFLPGPQSEIGDHQE